jgi:hypothetical protein
MRSSRLRKTKPQDDEIKAHPPLNPPSMGEFVGWYFQDRYSCCLSASVDDENPRFDLPWYIATLIKE